MFTASEIAEIISSFGEIVVIDTAGDSRPLTAIFDNGGESVQLGDGSIETTRPSLRLATSDIQDIVDAGEIDESGTTANVRGTIYRVISHVPDGEGFSTFVLTQGA